MYISSPCHNCAERYVACWSKCRKYIDYKKQLDQEKQGIIHGRERFKSIHCYSMGHDRMI